MQIIISPCKQHPPLTTNPLLVLGKAVEDSKFGTVRVSSSLCKDLEDSVVFHFIRDNWVIQLPLWCWLGEEGRRAGEGEGEGNWGRWGREAERERGKGEAVCYTTRSWSTTTGWLLQGWGSGKGGLLSVCVCARGGVGAGRETEERRELSWNSRSNLSHWNGSWVTRGAPS